MKASNAVDIIGKEAVQVFFFRAVQQEADVQAFVTDQVRHVADQEVRALFQLGVRRHLDSSSKHRPPGEASAYCVEASGSRPVRKRLQRTVLGVNDGLTQFPPPFVEPFGKTVELPGVVAAPLGRNPPEAVFKL